MLFVLCIACLLIIIFPHQIATKRGQVGNCPSLTLCAYCPPFLSLPFCSTPLINLLINFVPSSLSQALWDITSLPSLLFSLLQTSVLLSQYWDTNVKWQYWEVCLIAFRSLLWIYFQITQQKKRFNQSNFSKPSPGPPTSLSINLYVAYRGKWIKDNSISPWPALDNKMHICICKSICTLCLFVTKKVLITTHFSLVLTAQKIK